MNHTLVEDFHVVFMGKHKPLYVCDIVKEKTAFTLTSLHFNWIVNYKKDYLQEAHPH